MSKVDKKYLVVKDKQRSKVEKGYLVVSGSYSLPRSLGFSKSVTSNIRSISSSRSRTIFIFNY